MVRSMTGYGRCEDASSGRTISVEIKSVNHRYFEFSARVPRTMGFLEDKLKSYVQSRVSRGKVELYLSVEDNNDKASVVSVNNSLAAGYVNAVDELSEKYGLRNDMTAALLSRYPDVLTVHKPQEDEDALWESVKSVASRAVDAFVKMREVEGEKLRCDMLEKIGCVLSSVSFIETEAPLTVSKYRERLEEKMRELLGDTAVDEQRLLTETAIFADKIAVDEETVRLRSHMSQITELLDSSEPIGRKLDFMLQESNREINTIGSKSQNSSISKTVVSVKADLEKMREQLQNIE